MPESRCSLEALMTILYCLPWVCWPLAARAILGTESSLCLHPIWFQLSMVLRPLLFSSFPSLLFSGLTIGFRASPNSEWPVSRALPLQSFLFQWVTFWGSWWTYLFFFRGVDIIQASPGHLSHKRIILNIYFPCTYVWLRIVSKNIQGINS